MERGYDKTLFAVNSEAHVVVLLQELVSLFTDPWAFLSLQIEQNKISQH